MTAIKKPPARPAPLPSRVIRAAQPRRGPPAFTRRVRLVREKGRGVSSQYGREGEGGGGGCTRCSQPHRSPSAGSTRSRAARSARPPRPSYGSVTPRRTPRTDWTRLVPPPVLIGHAAYAGAPREPLRAGRRRGAPRARASCCRSAAARLVLRTKEPAPTKTAGAAPRTRTRTRTRQRT